MKKILSIALVLTLTLSLFGCTKPTAPNADPSGGGTVNVTPNGDDKPTAGGDDGKIKFVYAPPTEQSFCIPSASVDKLVSLAKPFNSYPEEFTDPSELSDYALFFAAASKLRSNFIASSDNFSYSISFSLFPNAIKEMFGDGAAFSADFASKSYEPYAFDAATGTVTTYGIGEMYSPLFTFAVVPLEDGYELWLIDLMDDNITSRPELLELVEFGKAEEITYDMIKDFALDMQTNVYSFKDIGDGKLILSGFRYENYKGLSHYLI